MVEDLEPVVEDVHATNSLGFAVGGRERYYEAVEKGVSTS
jgi:hypothetical protein